MSHENTLPLSMMPAPTLDGLIEESFGILDEAHSAHAPSKVFACFSGGTDSLATALLLERYAEARDPRKKRRRSLFTGCIHINTGISVPEANEYARRTCSARRWPLVELHPPDMSYEEFVLEYGFPGPASHRYCYVWLKERALNYFVSHVAKNAAHDRVMLVTGARAQESKRRMGYTKKMERVDCKVWVAPLYYWSKLDCLNFILREEAEISPVAKTLNMSGECLCGAFANNDTTGELDKIGLHYPALFARIENLQGQAKEKGVHCRWGVAPMVEQRLLTDDDLPLFTMCQQCDAFRAEVG